MRNLLTYLLLAFVGTAGAQTGPLAAMPFQDSDLEVMQGGLAWLLGDHVKARRHFRAAAGRGDLLGQYNLAMMLLHGEGGPCAPVEGAVLLHRAAEAGVELAREAQARLQDRVASHGRDKAAFTCVPAPARVLPSTLSPSQGVITEDDAEPAALR